MGQDNNIMVGSFLVYNKEQNNIATVIVQQNTENSVNSVVVHDGGGDGVSIIIYIHKDVTVPVSVILVTLFHFIE